MPQSESEGYAEQSIGFPPSESEEAMNKALKNVNRVLRMVNTDGDAQYHKSNQKKRDAEGIIKYHAQRQKNTKEFALRKGMRNIKKQLASLR
jgi:hypothetical protein